jgi:hypothetical protein
VLRKKVIWLGAAAIIDADADWKRLISTMTIATLSLKIKQLSAHQSVQIIISIKTTCAKSALNRIARRSTSQRMPDPPKRLSNTYR